MNGFSRCCCPYRRRATVTIQELPNNQTHLSREQRYAQSSQRRLRAAAEEILAEEQDGFRAARNAIE